jgi:hypothetical protein
LREVFFGRRIAGRVDGFDAGDERVEGDDFGVVVEEFDGELARDL